MIINKEGQQVPDVIFRVRRGDDWQNLSTKDVFSGKTVVVFARPAPSRQPAHPLTCRATTSWPARSSSMASMRSSVFQ